MQFNSVKLPIRRFEKLVSSELLVSGVDKLSFATDICLERRSERLEAHFEESTSARETNEPDRCDQKAVKEVPSVFSAMSESKEKELSRFATFVGRKTIKLPSLQNAIEAREPEFYASDIYRIQFFMLT